MRDSMKPLERNERCFIVALTLAGGMSWLVTDSKYNSVLHRFFTPSSFSPITPWYVYMVTATGKLMLMQ